VADSHITRKEIAAALRERALQLTPEDIGLDRSGQLPIVFGLVIETAHPDAVASLVALVDGSVSLYVSDGAGCVGCGNHRDVASAAAELMRLADLALPLSAPSNNLASLPARGTVRFCFLTPSGPRVAEAPLEDINTIDRRLGTLYFAGQNMLTTVERVGAGTSLVQEINLASIALGHDSAVRDQVRERALGGPECLSVGNAVRRLRT
jgi:hypothetical protein